MNVNHAPLSSDRRTFLKASAMAAATAVAAGTTRGARIGLPILDDRPESADDPAAGMAWNKGVCRFCGTGCHVRVGVRDGRVVAIAGDIKAEVNRGLLCVKGYHVGKILYGRIG